MSKQKEQVMSVRMLPNTTSNPPGKLADAEVVFEADAGPLNGLKLIGFAVWERRAGGRNVTFPARQYSVNGERRSFALLRPANGDAAAQEAIRDAILDAYSRLEAASCSTFTDTGRPAMGPPSGVHGGQPPTPTRLGWAASFGLKLPKTRADSADRTVMDAIAHAATRRLESSLHAVETTKAVESTRTLAVTA